MSTSENIFGQKITKNIEENVFEANLNETNKDYSEKVGDAINQFIKVIDIDDLSPEELLRIIVAVGSKNMAYYLALIVNFENRSRKISPLGIAIILSSKSVYAPYSNPIKNTFTADAISKNKDLNKS
jgi:hypothetical protein